MASRRTLSPQQRSALQRAVGDAIDHFDDQIASLTRGFDDIVDAAELVNTDDEHDP